jgi:ABC-type multidrug transport system fused ATPase/permease subunit
MQLTALPSQRLEQSDALHGVCGKLACRLDLILFGDYEGARSCSSSLRAPRLASSASALYTLGSFAKLYIIQASVNLSIGRKLPASLPPQPIRFRNVHFSYPSRPDSPILRGVNLDIERGRSIAIAGGSGSGKSTLVNLLVRYYDPSSGRIEYGPEDIKDYTPESWRERVSIVPQDPALFSQTIAENSKTSFSLCHLAFC